MSIKIKLRRNEIKSNKTYGKYFAETVSMGTIDADKLAEEISCNCSLKPSDVGAAIIALQEVMASHLQNGETVVLPGIGSFSLAAESKGVDAPKTFNLQHNICGIKCRFRPSGKRQGGKNGPIRYDLIGDTKVEWLPLYQKPDK
jgi:predicted histone-like DNA-binding protein